MKVSALYLLATFPKRRSRYQSIEAGTTFHIRPNAFDFRTVFISFFPVVSTMKIRKAVEKGSSDYSGGFKNGLLRRR
ncbi:hypothetical protein HR08_02405 [Porphyromonas gulae]|uniref:Uncharacterized protein n=1 Tax=Porphyromonas gulae TaxID=111105 RepID=A0A0A2FFW6_9PORP|nr:hypothetical protein HR08_02405 [Porphyromonas gulae]